MGMNALYPGSFDPVTFGHLDLIRRASRMFDRLVVAIGTNVTKSPLFTAEERMAFIRAETSGLANLDVVTFEGMAVDCARSRGLGVILRGIRTVSDFESEYVMAMTNRGFAPEIETICLMPDEKWALTSSRLIREIAVVGGDVSRFVPAPVASALARRLKSKP